jgi:hypothetical protein
LFLDSSKLIRSASCGYHARHSLARKLDELERKLQTHDRAIVDILKAIRELMNPPAPRRRSIGFTADLEE